MGVPAVDAYALPTTLGFLMETSAATLRLILGGLYVRHPDFKLYLVHIGSLLPYILGRLDYEAERYEGAMGKLTVPPSEHVKRLYTDSVCVYPPALRLALEHLRRRPHDVRHRRAVLGLGQGGRRGGRARPAARDAGARVGAHGRDAVRPRITGYCT